MSPDGYTRTLSIRYNENMDMESLKTMQCDAALSVDELHGDPSDWLLEPKWDGFRLVSHIKEDGVDTYTRSMKLQNGKLPYIDEELASIFPHDTVVDGEVIALKSFPDGRVDNDFEHVQSIMLSLPERAVQHAEETRPLDYVIFDVTRLGGIDLRDRPLSERKALLQLSFEASKHEDAPELKRISRCITFDAKQETYLSYCELGYEGMIAKRKDSKYLNDRSKGWVKLKKTWEMDAVVVGFIEGSKGTAYEGLIGSLVFAQPAKNVAHATHQVELNTGMVVEYEQGDAYPTDSNADLWLHYTERGSCSGITLDMRHEISANREEWRGKVIAVRHMGLMKDGIHVRHPQFLRERPDKPVDEVIWSER